MKKRTNQILIIVLLILLAAFVATRLFRSPARESNLDVDLFAIDTAEIAGMRFKANGAEELTLARTNDTWKVQQSGKGANAEKSAVNNLLTTLSTMRPDRIVTRKKEKWETYQVNDTASVHFTAYDGEGHELVNWRVGKESQGLTYIRPADESEVYVLEGSLRTRLDKGFKEWRDNTFIRLNPATINQITFTYPDSGFVLKKNGTKWLLDGQPADSVQVDRYFNKLRSRNYGSFEESFSPGSEPDLAITIETTDSSDVVMKAWKSSGNNWTITSTYQDSVYSNDASIVKDLFPAKRTLLGQ